MPSAKKRGQHPTFRCRSAAGYLYQCQTALLELLRRGWDEPDLILFLEKLDDVELQRADAREALQIKHHTGKSGSVTDASVDLWRTLAVWLDVLPGLAPGEQPSFTLLTTGRAPDGSAASLLRADFKQMAHRPALGRTRETTFSRGDHLKAIPSRTALVADRDRRLVGRARRPWLPSESSSPTRVTIVASRSPSASEHTDACGVPERAKGAVDACDRDPVAS